MQQFIDPSLGVYSIPVVEDNRGAIKLANNPSSSKRTRHVDVKHRVVRDTIQEGEVIIIHVKTEEQHADALTKALDMKMFNKHIHALMNVE